MTNAARPSPDNEPTAADLTAFLRRLGRPGARLRSLPTGPAIVSKAARRDAAPATSAVPAAIIVAARAAGYLLVETSEGQSGPCEVLSPAGRSALRTALMAQPAEHQNRRRPASRGTRRATLATADTGQRAVERMTVVEQLGHRRDRHGQPLLSDIQVLAALRLAQDFAIGKMQPRVTARWSAEAVPDRRRRGAPGAGVELADATAAAQTRVRTALASLGGGLADIVFDVCCLERGLESLEADRDWPPRTARLFLCMALTNLAVHYGMDTTPRSSAAIRQWGDDAFRPTAQSWTRRADKT